MKQARGMTLLEVLIALAIFATASMSVIRAVSQHVNTIQTLEEKAFAAMVADNQLTKVLLSPKSLKNQDGKEKMAGRTWFWKIAVIKTESPVLKAFDVSVALKKSGSSIVTVRSYIKNEQTY